MLKKKLRKIIKDNKIKFFFKFYPKIKNIVSANTIKDIKIKKVKFKNFPPYNVYEIKDTRIYTDKLYDVAIIKNNNLLDGPSFQLRNNDLAKTRKNEVLKFGTPYFKKNLKGTTVSFLTGGFGNENYWHWLFDVLPKFALLERTVNLEKIDHFLLPNITKKFQKETLDILNIRNKKRLSSFYNRHLSCEKLIVIDHPRLKKSPTFNRFNDAPRWSSNWLRKKFLKNIKPNKKLPKKFYIDRKDSENKNRIILNESKLVSILKRKKFKIINLSKLSFSHQIALFNNANTILGLHGAGFSNLVFCKPKAKIIEIRPKNFKTSNVIKNLSKHNNLNLKYHSLDCKTISKTPRVQDGIIEVPLEKLNKLI